MKCLLDECGGSSLPAGHVAPRRKTRNDSLNRDGAMALARKLEAYWHSRGCPAARFWAEPIDERFDKLGTHELYRVKCNLVNGLPPDYSGQAL